MFALLMGSFFVVTIGLLFIIKETVTILFHVHIFLVQFDMHVEGQK